MNLLYLFLINKKQALINSLFFVSGMYLGQKEILTAVKEKVQKLEGYVLYWLLAVSCNGKKTVSVGSFEE